MIFQIVEGTNVRQLFISSGRLIYRRTALYAPPTLTLELDVQANDPQYKRVEIGITGVVNLMEREQDAKSK